MLSPGPGEDSRVAGDSEFVSRPQVLLLLRLSWKVSHDVELQVHLTLHLQDLDSGSGSGPSCCGVSGEPLPLGLTCPFSLVTGIMAAFPAPDKNVGSFLHSVRTVPRAHRLLHKRSFPGLA